MTPYKGIVRIFCKDKKCKDKLIEPAADCMNCDRARVEVLDLEETILAVFNRKKERSAKLKTQS